MGWLAFSDGKRVAVWFIVNIENWDIEKPIPRTVLLPPGNPVHAHRTTSGSVSDNENLHALGLFGFA